jgi:hypothetical protein
MVESQTPLIDLETDDAPHPYQQVYEDSQLPYDKDSQQDSQQQNEDYSNMQLQTQAQVALPLPYATAMEPPVGCLPKIKIGKYIYVYEKSEQGNREVGSFL